MPGEIVSVEAPETLTAVWVVSPVADGIGRLARGSVGRDVSFVGVTPKLELPETDEPPNRPIVEAVSLEFPESTTEVDELEATWIVPGIVTVELPETLSAAVAVGLST